VAIDREQTFAILDLLETGIIQLDGNGRILQMNSAAEHCLLASRDRATGHNIFELADVPPALQDTLSQTPRTNHVRRLHELKFGGGIFDCTIQTVDDGNFLLELNNLEWEQMRLRLQQRELQTGMLELLSRNLGHEVRNPLGGIRGAAQMLAAELESEDLSSLARLIMRESDRIDELIQRFGQRELVRQQMDVYPLLDEVLVLLLAEFGDSVRVERDYDPSIPSISADASAIRRVLLNLLRNAYQAEPGTVLIRTRMEHGSALLQSNLSSVLRLDVIDDGQGVPESLQSLLFLPLVTGRRDGTGLGLSLSQQIASAHGGLLTFEALDQGSRFSFYLPLAQNGSNSSEPEAT
jgi:two-component system nitrogen regulation sensor histidine kinase GlnL